jgi:hypothetical protein
MLKKGVLEQWSECGIFDIPDLRSGEKLPAADFLVYKQNYCAKLLDLCFRGTKCRSMNI